MQVTLHKEGRVYFDSRRLHSSLGYLASLSRPDAHAMPESRSLTASRVDLGGEMGVAHAHLDDGVPQELRDGLERGTSHDDVARERMPQDVPADATLPCPIACAPEWPLALGFFLQRPVQGAEHAISPEMPGCLSLQSLSRQRNLAGLPLFGGPSIPRTILPSDFDILADDVGP